MSVKLQRFVPVYRWPIRSGVGGWHITIAGRVYETEKAARTIARGPNTPLGIEVIDVLPITYTVQE